MGVKSYIKNTFKNNANVKGWVAWDAIKDNAQTIGSFVEEFKVSPAGTQAPVKKTFEQAAAERGLTEKDLRARMRTHWQVAIVCILLGLLALGWGIMLLVKGMFLSSLVSLSLMVLMFAYAFREHFSYFQIKQRRLNCTFGEWISSFYLKQK